MLFRSEIPLPTMKNCAGFIDFYKKSFTIPLWSDLIMRVGPKDNPTVYGNFADKTSSIEFHSEMQRGTYLPSNEYLHGKILSPWKIKCKEEIKFLFHSSFYNMEKPERIIFPPGVVDYKYQNSTNINLFFKLQEEHQDFFIKNGQPLINIFPLTEKKIEIKIHMISNKEYDSMNIEYLSHINNYNESKKNKKKLEKCPFKNV